MSINNPGLITKVQVCLTGNLTADTNGRAIDTIGCNSLAFFYSFGTTTTGTSATATLLLEDSATEGGTYVAISGATTAALTLDTGGQDAKKVLIVLKDLRKYKRWIRAVLDVAGTSPAPAATGPANCGGVLMAGTLDVSNPTTVVDTYVAA